LKLDLQALGAVRPRSVLGAVEIALCAALAVQAARLVWTVATPLGPLGEPVSPSAPAAPPADLSILAQFDPFFRLGPAAASGESAPASGSYTLYGVRAAPGGRGSAILGSEGQQRSYAVGQEVEPGLVLAKVEPDHVILARGADRQRIGFPRPSGGGAVMPMAQPAAAFGPAADAAPALNARRLLEQTMLVPRMRDGQPAGYQVVPRGQGELLRVAGLQRGDVLLAVDGVVLTPERVSQLPEELSGASGAELRFERNGQIMTTRIRMAAP
jgi:general secretion pathway protein C